MATVIGKEQLCSTDLKYFKSLQGVEGKTLFDRYKLAEANIIKKYIDSKYQDFLAYPVQNGTTITFHGKKYNETPQLLSELQENDRSKYTTIKEETLAHYKNQIDLLRNSGKIDDAEFLAGAVKYVDERFVYCYDNNVILGVWGMQLRNNVRTDISEIWKNLVKKKEETPPPDPPINSHKKPVCVPTFENVDTTEGPVEKPPFIPPVPKLPWWKRFWRWLIAKGCLRWLLWLLLLLLLLLLLCWLFRGCKDNNLYVPVLTPPEYNDVLPPQQGVLPPIEDNPAIIPGNPSIIANRLNILMENEDKSIFNLAQDFKVKYPDDKYKIIYYDDVVKRMQIEFPKEEREQLKLNIPKQFAPEYKLFVFDEALFEGAYIPNDPAFSDPDKTWYLNTIRAPQAWDITRGSEKITVAIVDNGFNLKHPELSNKVVLPYNVWKHSDEVFPQEVDHGTHVAGTALAIANNGKGICGIAPNCKFMPIQVADKRGIMTTTSVLDGILYALYQGADVVNISLGNQFTALSQLSESTQKNLIYNHFKEEERLWREIMRIAASHNATIVVAAGNNNVLAGIDALQRPELFITVSAVNKNNQNFSKAKFSNYGHFSTISAPGVGIYSSVGKNDYQSMDGTSMAAPIVTGAVALMKSINDTITTKQIICILQNTGIETQGNIGKLIQLDKALEKVKSGEAVNCTPAPSTGDVQILLSWDNYNDLDLACIDPEGNSIWYKNRRVPSGGLLEIDMNVEANDSQKPIENIYWQQGSAPNGTYKVYLWLYKQHESNISETPYKITIKYGDKTKEFTGSIKRDDGQIHICNFTVRMTKNS